jgi:hypothetical protein
MGKKSPFYIMVKNSLAPPIKEGLLSLYMYNNPSKKKEKPFPKEKGYRES